MSGGIYTLLIELGADAGIEVGALGPVAFDRGWYAYTGSALGSGGFARVERHRELARGERDTRHWHVDYLLGHPESTLSSVVTSPGVDAECSVARGIDGEPIPGFGVSDCDCETHLVFSPDRDCVETSVETAHGRVDDDAAQ